MTAKLFIRIPQQRHGEREGTETERERDGRRDGARREEEIGKDTGGHEGREDMWAKLLPGQKEEGKAHCNKMKRFTGSG